MSIVMGRARVYVVPTFEEIVKLDDMRFNRGQKSVVRYSVTRTQVQFLKPASEFFLCHPPGIFLDMFGDIFLQRIWDLLDLVVLEQPFIPASTPESRSIPSTGLHVGVKPKKLCKVSSKHTPPAHLFPP